MSELLQFTGFLKKRLLNELPGKSAHFKMVPSIRLSEFDSIPEDARKSSVLLLLFENDKEIATVLIERPEYNGVHSAQVSLPGGSFQETDKMLDQTALRETEEEIGVDRKKIRIIGSLTDLYIPPSNFRVKPFIGIGGNITGFQPDKHEVKSLHIININEFDGDKNIKTKKIRIQNGNEFDTCYYDINNLTIWGATAMILREFAILYREYLNAGNH